MPKRFLQYGAGNIGRSFIGALFARAGYEVVFADIRPAIIEALNREHRYKVAIHDHPSGEFWVEGVRAVDGHNEEAVVDEIVQCELMATSLGPRWLPDIFPIIARALVKRLVAGRPPLDIIIAENLRHAADVFRDGLRAGLPSGFPLNSYVGLVETSIGKMVPIMPEEIVRREPTLIYAEAHNTLILDKKAFRNPLPQVAGLDPKENIAAYVDRKLFLHNLGHAACAYLGHLKQPALQYVWQLITDKELLEFTRTVMWESALALMSRYPGEFNRDNLGAYIEDLLRRFANRALGDTVYRLGRDLPRKLSRDDRLIAALLLDEKMGISAPKTALAAAAAFCFKATDENGELFPADAEFHAALKHRGIDAMLKEVCGLNPADPMEQRIINAISHMYKTLNC